MVLELPVDRGKSITMMGAVSTKSDRAYVEIHPKTKKEYVNIYFRNYLPRHKGCIVIMDNHKCHKGSELKMIFQQNDCAMVFLPSVSSNLNPAEKLWSFVKKKWQNHLLGHTVTQRQARMVLLNIVDDISEETIRGIVVSSHGMMKSVHEGHLV